MFSSIIIDIKYRPGSQNFTEQLRFSFARTRILGYRPDTFFLQTVKEIYGLESNKKPVVQDNQQSEPNKPIQPTPKNGAADG